MHHQIHSKGDAKPPDSLGECNTHIHSWVASSDSAPIICNGLEQYTQCRGQRWVISAINASGFGVIASNRRRAFAAMLPGSWQHPAESSWYPCCTFWRESP